MTSFQLRGDAEAFAIEAKAKAEAEQMGKKAEAFKEYKDAAMVNLVLETLPKVKKILDRNESDFNDFDVLEDLRRSGGPVHCWSRGNHDGQHWPRRNRRCEAYW